MYKKQYLKYRDMYIIMKKQLQEGGGENYQVHNVIIIGGGCAGLSAAVYCARAELKPLLFAGNLEDKGGLLSKTSVVENYPGFPEGILGFDLVDGMEKQAIKYGTTIIDTDIVQIDFSNKPFTITDSDNTVYRAKSIVIATGSKPNKLGLERENEFWGKGISSCAVCDGALYKNKKIVVVGGGDSAFEHALFLTKFSDVTLIHRKDTFRASKIMQDRVLNNPKIKIIYDTTLTSFKGNQVLESIIIKNIKTSEESELKVDGLFYGLGLTPNTKLFQNILELDEEGYLVKKPSHKLETITSINGIFVAGDASDKIYRQAIVAAGDGCKAALDVVNYLNE